MRRSSPFPLLELEGQRTPCCWDSLHVFEVSEKGGRTTTYELTSTVMLSLGRVQGSSKMNLAGSLTRQVGALSMASLAMPTHPLHVFPRLQSKNDLVVKDQTSHVSNMGRMIEDMEAKMRNQLQVRRSSLMDGSCSSLRPPFSPCPLTPFDPPQEVYFGKTKDIVGSLRSSDSLAKQKQAKDLQKELMNLWKK